MHMRSFSSGGERRLLQAAIALAALVPILAGLRGVVLGLDTFGTHARLSVTGDSHVRYLSGLILAIGLGFWSTIPRIEMRGARFRLLTCLVLVGGLARLYGIVALGGSTRGAVGALLMELVVTPALALWRERVERLTQRERAQITSSVLSSVSP
jgi:hypothetical protein